MHALALATPHYASVAALTDLHDLRVHLGYSFLAIQSFCASHTIFARSRQPECGTRHCGDFLCGRQWAMYCRSRIIPKRLPCIQRHAAN
eukprot:COSAG02_NODE_6361_length_3624_cov_1.946099_4_plen_89_part_00